MTSRILHSCLKCSRLYCTFFRAGMWVGKFNNSYKNCKWTCSGPAVSSQEFVRQAHVQVWKSVCARLLLVLIVSENGRKQPKRWEQPSIQHDYDRGTRESVTWWYEGWGAHRPEPRGCVKKQEGHITVFACVCISISKYPEELITVVAVGKRTGWPEGRPAPFYIFWVWAVWMFSFKLIKKLKQKNSYVLK